jgi:hypothetical protein
MLVGSTNDLKPDSLTWVRRKAFSQEKEATAAFYQGGNFCLLLL